MSDKVFYTFGGEQKEEMAESIKTLNNGLENNEGIHHAKSSSVFKNILPNTSVRDGYSRDVYEYFRPGEALPKTLIDEMKCSNSAYKRIGIIRNVIDLMADFGCQGIRLVHKSKKWQKFYKEWALKIDFVERSERFLNLLYRLGNVVVKRSTAKLKMTDIKRLNKGFAKLDLGVVPPVKPEKREIPWDYEFIHPATLKIVGGELGAFVGKPIYAMEISDNLIEQIRKPKNKIERNLVAQIPEYITGPIKRGEKEIVLDPEKTNAYFYKKDDWELWASPMLASVLDDIIHFDKLKQADNAALDGAITHIRIWKLGNLENKIMPGPAAFERLNDILLNNVGGGSMDLLWGPDIQLEETSTDLHKFLGSEKYAQTLNNIYSGLGIPPSLTGAGGTGFTNNMVSIKTLIERLEYGRTILKEFWEKEIKLIQQAMGIPEPAYIVFDNVTLTDEQAEKALWIQLCDRDIITIEAVQERFGLIPEVQEIMQKREMKERESKPKAGPYHNANQKQDLTKLALQQGSISPKEAGLDVGDKSLLQHNAEQADKQAQLKLQSQPKGVQGQGRPVNKKDKSKRQRKNIKPIGSSKAFLLNLSWATDAQKSITSIVNPIYLASINKKNLRELSEQEFNSLENYKHSLLYMFKVGEEINEKSISEKTDSFKPMPQEVLASYNEVVLSSSKALSVDEQRRLHAAIYAALNSEEKNNG